MGVEHAALGQSDAGVGKFAPTSRRSFVAVWCWRARSISTSTKVWNSSLNSDMSSKASRDPPTFSLSPRNVSCYCVHSVNCRRFYLTFIVRSATWFTRFLIYQTTKIHVVLNIARLSLKLRVYFSRIHRFEFNGEEVSFQGFKDFKVSNFLSYLLLHENLWIRFLCSETSLRMQCYFKFCVICWKIPKFWRIYRLQFVGYPWSFHKVLLHNLLL